MAIFVDNQNKKSFNTVNFDGMDITKADEQDLIRAGLYSVNLLRQHISGLKATPMFVGPEEQASEIFSLVNNFWFAERKLDLPEAKHLSFEDINNSFNEIIRGDSGAEPGEFGIYKISGKVVLFVINRGGLLEDGFTDQRFFNIYLKDGKDTLFDFIQPLIHPDLFQRFRKYILGKIDLQQFKKTVNYLRNQKINIRNEEFIPNQR